MSTGEQSFEVELTSSFLIFFATGRPIASAGLLAFSRDGLRDCLCKKSGSFTGFSPLWSDKEVAESYSRFSHRRGDPGWWCAACSSPPPPSSAGPGGWAGRAGRACGRPCVLPSGQRRRRRMEEGRQEGRRRRWGYLRALGASQVRRTQGSLVATQANLQALLRLLATASTETGPAVAAAAASGRR